ncbi:MAG: hypothetical protein H6Q44_1092, partial [Deltaproteobacteria bacterium]|nr:hypothetical protein [Deltaproteobacteria bacterium]
MRRKVGNCRWTALFIFMGMVAGGCYSQAEDKRQAAKVAERPPVAVEVTKVQSSEVTGTIEVTGSLSYKFAADVKSEYTGIVTDVFVT